MTALREMPSCDERLDLLDALIYADVFDCAVTLDELWRYSRVTIDRDALRRRLRDDPSLSRIVSERDALYCLADRPGLLDKRPQRIERARVLQRRAHRVARVLRHVPFVRGLALTGSVAADDALEAADVDLLVIVAPARLGIAFLVLGSASRLLGRRLFCPNYYICEDQLKVAPSTLYVARELAQAKSLVGDARVLHAPNPWLGEVFPNAVVSPGRDRELPAGSRLQRLLDAPLRGTLGDRLERWARRVALARLRTHYGAFGRGVPPEVMASLDAGVELRFHGQPYDETTLARYTARRAQVAEWLEARGAEQLA